MASDFEGGAAKLVAVPKVSNGPKPMPPARPVRRSQEAISKRPSQSFPRASPLEAKCAGGTLIMGTFSGERL
jgi:hypothetical protein